VYDPKDDLPGISIIMACYNEENDIEKKIISTFNTNYPLNRIEFLIGSDNSTDRTNDIIRSYSEKFSLINFFEFYQRTGKINIINILKEKAKNDILIFTDTKVFFRKDTIFNLIKHLKNKEIALTGGILFNNKLDNKGIYIQENAYMNREMQTKYNEGLIYGSSMGVFGAIYAIKKEYFNKIPVNYKVDDFYITMKVLNAGKKVIFVKDAVADETLTGNLKEEFKRKVRISTGNYQNLKHFFNVLFKFWKPYSYIFLSHKVIRWLGPFFMITIIISLSFLTKFTFYNIVSGVFIVLMALSLFDLILSRFNKKSTFLRFISHFFTMNIALAVGFIKFSKGVKSSIWEPSKRV